MDWQLVPDQDGIHQRQREPIHDYGENNIAHHPSQQIEAADSGLPLENPPSEADDFSWDEQSSSDHAELAGTGGEHSLDEERSAIDGMASLSVEDRGAGYLGIASGAAMLRLLLPDAEHRRVARPSPKSQPSAKARVPAQSPQHQGWVPTPVWTEKRIGDIDLDAAIDSYFSLYHVSYPIVHEPTFRAQYSQVIPRPSGRTWNALAYIIGAIGFFTTATGNTNDDITLSDAAWANISMDSLESGNITLVQVLALMSNYLQKRNKPNSGYNYLGLAMHVALSCGLHKEFRNWSITPLGMETRRRVWWTLYVFFIGATITFGRPLSWPTEGVEVALPLNLDD